MELGVGKWTKKKEKDISCSKKKTKIKEWNWQKNVLFKECIDSLNEYSILSLDETEALFKQLRYNFPMTNYGCIDWKKVNDVIVIKNICDISDIFNKSYEYYILWEQQELPCVSCKLAKIIDNIDDVLAVSFDTWLLSKDKKEIIEFHHEGKVVYGKTNK